MLNATQPGKPTGSTSNRPSPSRSSLGLEPAEDTAVVLRFSLVVSGQLQRIDAWRKIPAAFSPGRGDEDNVHVAR